MSRPGVAFHGCMLVQGLFLMIFDTYLMYEKGWLSIESGETEQRIGRIAEAGQPAMFCTSTVFDMVMGTLVAGLFHR